LTHKKKFTLSTLKKDSKIHIFWELVKMRVVEKRVKSWAPKITIGANGKQ